VIVAESSRARRLVGSLDRGTDLLLQLVEVCRSHRVHAGALRATGRIEDPAVGARQLPGACEILSLNGTIRASEGGLPTVQVWVTLAREGSVELVGGRLGGARVIACDFVIDAFDDAPVEVAKPAAPTFEAPARTSWSDVIAASGRRTDSAPPVRPAATPVEDEPTAPHSSEPVNVRAGDLIDHPKFGRCAVERVDGDQEFVTARLRNQRLIRLSLDVLTLIPAGQVDGKNLFRAVAGT
jgi:predicted DNA-binding protein with PD1-like motif